MMHVFSYFCKHLSFTNFDGPVQQKQISEKKWKQKFIAETEINWSQDIGKLFIWTADASATTLVGCYEQCSLHHF